MPHATTPCGIQIIQTVDSSSSSAPANDTRKTEGDSDTALHAGWARVRCYLYVLRWCTWRMGAGARCAAPALCKVTPAVRAAKKNYQSTEHLLVGAKYKV
jgi:hypothetical protein